MEASWDKILESGVLGAIVIIFATVIVFLWRAYERTIQARIDDYKAMQVQHVGLIEKFTTALNNVNNAVEQNSTATLELRSTLKEFGEELRSLGDDIRKQGGHR